jgi:hypothetical protein
MISMKYGVVQEIAFGKECKTGTSLDAIQGTVLIIVFWHRLGLLLSRQGSSRRKTAPTRREEHIINIDLVRRRSDVSQSSVRRQLLSDRWKIRLSYQLHTLHTSYKMTTMISLVINVATNCKLCGIVSPH